MIRTDQTGDDRLTARSRRAPTRNRTPSAAAAAAVTLVTLGWSLQPTPARADIATCDRLAAAPHDQFRQAEPTSDAALRDRAEDAVAACRAAVSEAPEAARLKFQLGRALELMGDASEALEWYDRAHLLGYPAADAALAALFRDGRGLRRSRGRAVIMARAAHDAGDPRGTVLLVALAVDGAANLGGLRDRRRLLRDAAIDGYAPAATALALSLQRGPEEEWPRALPWLRRAADGGDAAALIALGATYLDGRGVASDRAEGVRWLRVAAEAGDPKGMMALAAVLAEEPGGAREAAALYEAAAARGLREAVTAQGGLAESRGDLAGAARWWSEAADLGDPEAMRRLAELLAAGAGVAQDYPRAIALLEAAAAAGDADAAYQMGLLLESGDWAEGGLAQDPAAAARRYGPLAAAGDPRAQHRLGVLTAAGTGVLRDRAEAARLWKLSADAGYGPGLYAYGVALADGVGVRRNRVEAVDWLRRAIEAGEHRAGWRAAVLVERRSRRLAAPEEIADWMLAAALAGETEARTALTRTNLWWARFNTRRALQRRLEEAGLYAAGIDGSYGRLSRRAAQQFLDL